jgi:hypothetical protein
MRKKIILTLLTFLVFALTGACVFLYYQYQTMKNQLNNNEAKQLLKEVGKLMMLPENEIPTVATVTDIKKLKNQPFFAKAVNGDKVMIFNNAKLAILYSPKMKKIINVGPLNIVSPAPKSTQAKIIIWNGTDTSGLGGTVEKQLQKEFPGITITKLGDAKEKYSKTIIIILNPQAKNAAENLAEFFSASISELPAGEIKPVSGDILVILGKDTPSTF